MLTLVKLNLNERLVVETKVNHYRVLGPGRVWMTVGQQPLAKLDVGPSGQTFTINEVLTVEKVPVEITVAVRYRIDPNLFTENLWPCLAELNNGGWQQAMQRQVEYVLRQLLADYSWPDLGRQTIQHRLERQLTQILIQNLKEIALSIQDVCLVKTALPPDLQRTIIRAQRDSVEARGRALILQEYRDIFGQDLPAVMPYIIQWELLTMLHKSGNSHLLLAATDLSLGPHLSDTESLRPVYQMKLPAHQEG